MNQIVTIARNYYWWLVERKLHDILLLCQWVPSHKKEEDVKWLKDKCGEWLFLVLWDNHAICLAVRPTAPLGWSAYQLHQHCKTGLDFLSLHFFESTLLQLILSRL